MKRFSLEDFLLMMKLGKNIMNQNAKGHQCNRGIRHQGNQKKFKSQTSSGKIMPNVFWGAQGLTCVDFLPRGKTTSSKADIEILQKIRTRIQ